MNVWRMKDGNLQHKDLEVEAQIRQAKAEGWLPTEEMWPEPKKVTSEAKEKK